MGPAITWLGRVNAVLLPALRGYAGCGVAGGLAAAYCAATGVSAENAAVLVPVAVALGERIERAVIALWTRWTVHRAMAARTAPGSVVDRSTAEPGVASAMSDYERSIKRYCGHSGFWHASSFSCRTLGHAKAGGWAKAETMDGRVYDLDRDVWE
jgi:hypothetical protein